MGLNVALQNMVGKFLRFQCKGERLVIQWRAFSDAAQKLFPGRPCLSHRCLILPAAKKGMKEIEGGNYQQAVAGNSLDLFAVP